MTVCQRENISMSTENASDTSVSETRDLDDLFYESVSLSEKLSRCVSGCQVFLQDQEFRRERDQCEEVLDQDIPEVLPPSKPERIEAAPAKNRVRSPSTQSKTGTSHEMTEAPDDDHVTEEMKMSSSSSASSLTESEIELSDELTEVSSTDSISNHSDRESIDLEIDDFNFKDCSITRKVNSRPHAKDRRIRSPKKEMSTNERTRLYLDEVDKKVSCKCCRSVMGRIIHEVRQSEKAANIAKLKPYQPKTSVITNVMDAVDFQLRYESEWYAAIMIQRAWKAYNERKMQQIRKAEIIREKNEMRLKYGHIAGFVLKRDAIRRKQFGY